METIFDKPLDKQVTSNTQAIANLKTGEWHELTQAASEGVTITPTGNFASSGYIVRGGICFVNLNIELASPQGDSSKMVVYIPQASLKNTVKPPAWSSYGTGNTVAESLFQGGYLYIRNAVAGTWSISFCYPVANP